MSESDPFGPTDPLWAFATEDSAPFGVGETEQAAIWIGRIVYGYSAIEFQFFLLFALCSNLSSNEAYVAFYKARNVHAKELLSLKAGLNVPVEFRASIKKMWGLLRAAADRRTQVSHCVIMKKTDGLVSVQLLGDKPFFVAFDRSKIERTIRQYRILQTDSHMLQACLHLWRPDRFRRKLAELKLPRHAEDEDLSVDPGPLPPHVKAARDASLKRLGLSDVLIVESGLYPNMGNYDLRFGGRLVLWVNSA